MSNNSVTLVAVGSEDQTVVLCHLYPGLLLAHEHPGNVSEMENTHPSSEDSSLLETLDKISPFLLALSVCRKR